MSDGVFGVLEQPSSDPIRRDDFLPDGRLLVRGWAIDPRGRPAELSARIDAGPRHPVTTGGVRDDVFLAYPEQLQSGRSGFVALLPAEAGAGADAPQKLVVEAREGGGWRTLAERTVAERRAPVPFDDDALLGLWPGRPLRSATAPERVLLVGHNFNLEGAPRSLLELGGQLLGRGMDVRVLGPQPGPLCTLWEQHDVTVGYVGDPTRIPHLDDYAQRVRRLAALESRFAPDCVVANTLDAFWAIDLAEALGVRSAWIVRESTDVESYYLARWPYEMARRALGAFERASRVVFVSHATASLYADHVPGDRREVVWNGLDLEAPTRLSAETTRDEARRRLGLPIDATIVLCVGTVCQRKGQHVLVEALGQLEARGQAPVCVIVGARPGAYGDGLVERIRALRLEGRVRLVDETDAPFLYYRAADVFACPSFEESLPRVVLEAMAFRLPIVATRVFGIPEMIDDESGWLVEPGDVGQLASALAAIQRGPEAARRAGQRAFDRAGKDFRVEVMGERYAELVRGLCSRPAGRPAAG